MGREGRNLHSGVCHPLSPAGLRDQTQTQQTSLVPGTCFFTSIQENKKINAPKLELNTSITSLLAVLEPAKPQCQDFQGLPSWFHVLAPAPAGAQTLQKHKAASAWGRDSMESTAPDRERLHSVPWLTPGHPSKCCSPNTAAPRAGHFHPQNNTNKQTTPSSPPPCRKGSIPLTLQHPDQSQGFIQDLPAQGRKVLPFL